MLRALALGLWALGLLPVVAAQDEVDEAWFRPLDLEPFGRWRPFPLVPTVAGSRVLVSTTLRLTALDARTGDVAWQVGPPKGWERLSGRPRSELLEGVARQRLLVRPAVGANTAVVALQIPYTTLPREIRDGMTIRVAIPKRCLFAFDLETGEERWSHAPELVWEGEPAGFTPVGRLSSFAQRMHVGGSPVVSRSRVLVPLYAFEEETIVVYRVACYELATGAPVWTTPVARREVPANLFGRLPGEFTAAPLVVVGERVIAQTELGVLAALDLEDGTLVWRVEYERTAYSPTRSYRYGSIWRGWRIAPPAVSSDVVLATPRDSHELLAVGLMDGEILGSAPEWMLSHRGQETGARTAYDLLLGARGDTVFFANAKSITALLEEGGFASDSRFTLKWRVPLESTRAPGLPCLDGGRLAVPDLEGLRLLDAESGKQRAFLRGSHRQVTYGNAALGGGRAFVLSLRGLHAFVLEDEGR